MLSKLRRKPVLIGILSFIIVALVAGFAIPTFAAGSPPFGPRNGGNKNVTVVQGTIAIGGLTPTTITINKGGNASTQVTLTLNSSTNFNIHGTGWFSYSSLANGTTPVTAAYNSNQTAPPLTGPVASQVTINMPVPAPGTGNPPTNVNLARMQGTIALGTPGTIIITFTEPSTALTLGANKAVTILYNNSSPYAIQGLMSAGPGTTTTPARPTPTLPKNLAAVQGTIALGTPGTIIITFTEPSTALTLGANKAVTILYNNSSPYAIQGLMSAGPGGNFGGQPGGFFNAPGGNQPAPRFSRNGTTS
jgi:hypothetical protein